MAKRTSVEIQAVSVEDAVRLALEQLELSEADVDIEILSEEGPEEDAEALVRVTAKGMASQPVQSESTASADGKRSRNRRRGRGGRSDGESRDWLNGRTPGDRPSRRGRPPAPDGAVAERADAEDEAVAKAILQELLGMMSIDADVVAVDNPSAVTLSPDDPATIFLDIMGRDLGMLIGRRGEHLGHLQFLVNTLVNRKLETWTRVIVDVEGYRARREESLVGLAERVARQVARSGRSVVLEPMPANERRIVHLTLKQHPDVATHSDGEGSARRITVEPA